MSRIANGWELAKQSLSVLANDKKLLVFPIISSFACLLVMASFIVPMLLTIDWTTVKNSTSQQLNIRFNQPAYYALLFAFYFANYFVVIFFNSALVACVHAQFKQGRTPSFSYGLSAAAARLPQIALWALLSATIGMILQLIAERSKLVGQIVASLLGAAWTIATYFAVPVLVVEKAGPFDVFKRSVALLKQTWGESIVANLGIGFFVFVMVLVGALPVLIGIAVSATTHNPAGLVAGTAISLVCWVLIALISSTLKVILTTAIYEYAASGAAPGPFRGDLLQAAFRRK